MSLRTFGDAHFQVNGVAHDVNFYRVDAREDVAVVVIIVSSGIVVFFQSFVQVFLVVDITLLHVKLSVEELGSIDGVTHPIDVSDVVFLTFVHLQHDIDMLVVEVPHAVFQYDGVTVSVFVVFLNEVLLVFLPAFGCELLRFQEVGKLAGLVSLGEGAFLEQRTLDFLVVQFLVSVEPNIAHLHLFLLVHFHVENHLILVGHVITLADFNLGVLVSFVVKVFLGQDLSPVDNVRMQGHALCHAQFLLHVLALRLLESNVVDGRDFGARCQIEVQVDLVANERVDGNAHIREKSVAPVALYGVGDGRTWQFDVLADAQSGNAGQHIVFVAFHTRDVNASQYSRDGGAGIGYFRVHYFFLSERCER